MKTIELTPRLIEIIRYYFISMRIICRDTTKDSTERANKVHELNAEFNELTGERL